MKKILIFLTTITLFACHADDNKDDNVHWGASMEFSVFNADNEDLLNPENPKHLDVSKIKILYVIDGVTQEFFDSHLLDNPGNFRIFKYENEGESEYRIGVSLNDHDKSEKTITYIQWNETDRDTIESTFYKNKYSIRNKKIWLNGVVVWQNADFVKEPYVKLIK
ncbi:hypothetical protein [Flavobacterium sp. N1736]|uniref:hypothetical protein n=1 Tax=Flavobacterium sp. N1736 TaxID=2986823 RepID=UPI0022240ABC|nr:hypothetical protein [Flavobacterium sp. N1736]